MLTERRQTFSLHVILIILIYPPILKVPCTKTHVRGPVLVFVFICWRSLFSLFWSYFFAFSLGTVAIVWCPGRVAFPWFSPWLGAYLAALRDTIYEGHVILISHPFSYSWTHFFRFPPGVRLSK